MKDLQDIRKELDGLDRDMVALFEKRMTLARDVAAYKMEVGMPVLDRSREEQVLASRVAMLQDSDWEKDDRELYECIMALSRREQETMLREVQDNA